jgi:Cof subfamily protein (haloacid dehalogenase superfamily)
MDIDGTLLDSTGHLSEKNASAIAEATARGVEIVIVTGRRFHSARMIAQGLPCSVEVISSNGAVIKSLDGQTHYRRLLPADTAKRVLDATAEFRADAGVIFDRPAEAQIVFEQIDWDGPFVGPYLRRHRDQVAEIKPLTACLDGEDPVEVMFIGDCDRIRQAVKRLTELPGASDYTLALTEYLQRGLSMFDVLAPGVSKGAALSEWARRRGIERSEIMAIGDNWNDREMLEYVGLPVIMGNAVDELKSLGWTETLGCDESGVAHAIHVYVLKNL